MEGMLKIKTVAQWCLNFKPMICMLQEKIKRKKKKGLITKEKTFPAMQKAEYFPPCLLDTGCVCQMHRYVLARSQKVLISIEPEEKFLHTH